MNNPSIPVTHQFNPLKIIIPVLLALLSISLMAQWYANNIILPRYCEDPQKALQSLRELMDESSQLKHQQRRQNMIAAKLLFLHPQQSDESSENYLQRLRYLIQSECG